jgi:phenylpropionate dioxygenase-like ring-hydroxylating dioxygenase large terminal subunit
MSTTPSIVKPETGTRTHPRNAWYVAAWDHEIGRRLLSRVIAGTPMALYRTAHGRAVALDDACWHRLAPLSLGSLVGDCEVQCPYHGLRFDADGRCTFMPSQETVNSRASVRSYPVIERHRYMWVWPGDPSKADPTLVPDLHWNTDPGWTGDGDTLHIACDYRLLLDNLMDLTHEQFVHTTSIGSEALSGADFHFSHTERTATISRWMLNIETPPMWTGFLAHRFPDYRGNVDRWQILTFEAPSTIRTEVGVAKAGTGAQDGDRSQGVSGHVLNSMTPGEDGKCHYFWSFLRDFGLADRCLTTTAHKATQKVVAEDVRMLEAQQQAMQANPNRHFCNLNIDVGGVWVRRLLDRMMAAEE